MNNTSNDNIILIGFMGSGKSSVGHWMAENVNMSFLDTDNYIEEKENCSIQQIFKEKGEEYFRNLETKTLKDLQQKLSNTVISVGGGIPVKKENRELLKKLGTVVYLRASKETLIKRLKNDNTRPLLAGGNIEQKINDLMNAREAFYIEAGDVCVDTDDKKLEQIYNSIENAIIEYKNNK